MDRVRLATIWLVGCSGCHMSFLDLDEFLFDLADKVEVVFSPIADVKEFPENVAVTLVEGSVCNEDHLHLIRRARKNSGVLISFGDCAVTANVPSMRNPLGGTQDILKRAYIETADIQAQIPSNGGIVPRLLDKVLPVHEVVPVDFFLPGCPPPAARIRTVIEQLLAGQTPHLEGRDIKFG